MSIDAQQISFKAADLSDLLASYLRDSGLGQFELISASRTMVGSPTQEVETHAWLTQGELIIDITTDQFTGNQASSLLVLPAGMTPSEFLNAAVLA